MPPSTHFQYSVQHHFPPSQIPGGYLSSSLGGLRTLPPSVALWSLTTAILPLSAANLPALCITRSVMGAGEAIAPSAVVDMLARTVPKEQRASAVSSAFSGLHVGSVLGLLASPAIIGAYGWRSLFLTFGVVGLAWCVAFQALMQDIGRQEPEVLRLLEAPWSNAPSAPAPATASTAAATRTRKVAVEESSSSSASTAAPALHIPYRAMIRSRSVQVLAFTHFTHNWLHYTMLAWLPTYFSDTLSVDLLHASQTALLPPLASIVAASVAGRSADALIAGGMSVSTVRKAAQCTAFLVPAGLLTGMCATSHNAETAAASAVEASAPLAAAADAVAVAASAGGMSGDAMMTVASITVALGASAFSLAGLYCTHQDLSPKYASAMLGVTNTVAGLSGVVGISLVGFLLDQTNRSWELALFAPSALLLVAGAGAYTLFCSNDPVDYDQEDDSPFPWEVRLLGARKAWESLSRSAPSSSA